MNLFIQPPAQQYSVSTHASNDPLFCVYLYSYRNDKAIDDYTYVGQEILNWSFYLFIGMNDQGDTKRNVEYSWVLELCIASCRFVAKFIDTYCLVLALALPYKVLQAVYLFVSPSDKYLSTSTSLEIVLLSTLLIAHIKCITTKIVL